jgi:site-specific DNA-methyltransferase (adenine-specific)
MTENAPTAARLEPLVSPFYDRDGITIYNADCRDVLPMLGTFDLLLTDPPYGIALENHAAGKERRDRDWTVIGDDTTEIGEFVLQWADNIKLATAAFASPAKPWGGEWRSRLVWHKHGLGMGGDRDVCWKTDWELIQVRHNGPLKGPRPSSVLVGYDMRPADFVFHPCQKPVGLLSYLIDQLQAKTVLDPFMGSGTTLVAAKQLGLRAVGIEINREYCEAAVERLRQGVLDFGSEG